MDIQLLTDLLLDTNNDLRDIAKEMGVSLSEVREKIKDLGLDWIAKGKGVSRGQSMLLGLMRELFPGEDIVTEESIGHRLRLDVYCPAHKIAAEYHGRQHFQFVEHFHKDLAGFKEAQERDWQKAEICKEQGIALAVFTYKDVLSKQLVFDRLIQAMRETPYKKEESPSSYKGNPHYEKMMEYKREQDKKRYQKMKDYRRDS